MAKIKTYPATINSKTVRVTVPENDPEPVLSCGHPCRVLCPLHAAAPALLEACNRALHALNIRHWTIEDIRSLKDAIAAAEAR